MIFTSCDDSNPNIELIPDSINISSSYSIIKPEQQIQLKVQVLTVDNNNINDLTIAWTSDNKSIAIVDENWANYTANIYRMVISNFICNPLNT